MKYFILAFALVALSACGKKWGDSAPYLPQSKAPIAVEIPPDAPFIGQQYQATDEEQGVPGHLGIDMWGDRGTPVIAAAPGRVTRAFFDPAYGRRITIDHGTDETGQRVLTQYFHMSDFDAEVGDTVLRGEQIGKMGGSGFLGVIIHVHFEVLRGPTRSRARTEDPNLFWEGGVGKVTCFDRNKTYPKDRFVTVSPAVCRGDSPL